MDKPTLRERIILGECVSEYTCDRCPVCIDHCEASDYKFSLMRTLNEKGVELPKTEQP